MSSFSSLKEIVVTYKGNIDFQPFQAKDIVIKYPSEIPSGSHFLIANFDTAFVVPIAITCIIPDKTFVNVVLVNASNEVQTVKENVQSIIVKLAYY